LVTFVPLSLLNGLFYPRATILLMCTYFFGRYSYTNGYMENEGVMHPQRIVGSALVNLSKLATLGIFMWISV
jgi:hypothetical protein